MKSRRNWDSTLKLLYNLQQIGTNGERPLVKSPGVDIDLTDGDDTAYRTSKIEIKDALLHNKGSWQIQTFLKL